jgi:dihydrofolate reductase
MRKLVLFISASLDGYIARPDGGVDWMFTDQDYGFQAFYQAADAVLMGRRTYDQTLVAGDYPYPGKKAYVFSSRPLAWSNDMVETVAEDAGDFITQLKHGDGGSLWLLGGAALIKTCLEHDLIDELTVSIHPLMLGAGIPLFPTTESSRRLNLLAVQHFNSGLVQVSYERSRKSPMPFMRRVT